MVYTASAGVAVHEGAFVDGIQRSAPPQPAVLIPRHWTAHAGCGAASAVGKHQGHGKITYREKVYHYFLETQKSDKHVNAQTQMGFQCYS